MEYPIQKMPPQLHSLPVEITQLLAIALECLVCRELSRRTMQEFSIRFFTTLQTNMSAKSLQRLDNISKSECLAYYVKSLHITDEQHTYGQDYKWYRHISGQLIDSLPGVDLLQDILTDRLVKCRSFRIDCYNEIEVPKRTDCLAPGDIVGIIIAIVDKTSIAMRSLTIQREKGARWPGESKLDTNRLRIPLSVQGGLDAALVHLQGLAFNYWVTEDQYDWALGLITNAPRLRNLSLMFGGAHPVHSNSFMQRLISVQASARLKYFRLEHAHVNVTTICNFLRRTGSTLRVLLIRYVTVKDGATWATILKTLAANSPHLQNFALTYPMQMHLEQPHCIAFNRLTKIPIVPGSEEKSSRTQGLKVDKADQRFLEALGRPIGLRYSHLNEESCVVDVRYQGPAMGSFLRILAEAAELFPSV